ncbi:hypothetical protein EYF80_029915 [Liparis tanakae]|uniref:Uncharacterized protein n=1 Tax=Liparis tanakae TaxID=230148 RepID=A0A4Z2H256_9TELE|nr:hypothetical protein EYF80_029915 [Liparis tanakae]
MTKDCPDQNVSAEEHNNVEDIEPEWRGDGLRDPVCQANNYSGDEESDHNSNHQLGLVVIIRLALTSDSQLKDIFSAEEPHLHLTLIAARVSVRDLGVSRGIDLQSEIHGLAGLLDDASRGA